MLCDSHLALVLPELLVWEALKNGPTLSSPVRGVSLLTSSPKIEKRLEPICSELGRNEQTSFSQHVTYKLLLPDILSKHRAVSGVGIPGFHTAPLEQ
jgi:hypothetical protein